MTVKCTACKTEIDDIACNKAPSGASYCFNCWHNIAPSTAINRCNWCHLLCSQTNFIDGIGFVCTDCLEDNKTMQHVNVNGNSVYPLLGATSQTNSRVSTSNSWQPTILHVKLKFRGNEEERKFFDFTMKELDKDWPGLDSLICEKCQGVKYQRPILKEFDVLEVAQICGLRKVKVKHWALEKECLA